MDLDLDKTQDQSAEQNESSREGYKQAGSYRSTGRPMRPRIHSQRAYSTDNNGYSSNNVNSASDGGFRPEGFGVNLQGAGEGTSQRGGYQSRGGYGNNRGGYSNNRGGGYNNNRGGGYNNNRGGNSYRPRYNNEEEGGYQSRVGYNNDRGGYNNRGGYNGRGGGYNNNRGGGYNNNRGGGYNNNRGGFGNNRGGYGNQGGFRQHTPGFDPNAKYSLKKRIEYKEENFDPNEPIRLNKYLANAGVCSRREADEFIQAGVITVNGEVVTELGTKVMRTDEVKFHDQNVSLEKKVYVLLNKPKDYVTTSDDPQQRKTVMDLVKDACPERIYPVGRLDRNTTGVLLLTNDGDLASKLTHPKFLKKKVYHVYLDKPVAAHDLQQIADGITLEDGEIHADAIEYADEHDKKQVGIEIHSGKNRIVRRIFEALGYRVTKLDRVQFAGLTKKNLRRGDWRFLSEKEVDMLRMGAFE
ncbi:pseudouridine synthase [Segatella bryantii]|uniref:pseudouridine synthase n=1 Tax=Segatella bryantii TaxID=77095 RepID=UPI00242D3376|nr:pseudouridine synthase [Segatella bryantii]